MGARSSDRFLLGIVLGMVVLVAMAFAVVLMRPQPTYQPDGTPEGAVHNYLLALRLEEDARAYRYLSPSLAGYPESTEAFAADVRNEIRDLGSDRRAVALSVVETRVIGAQAWVIVRETWSSSDGLFARSTLSSTFDVRLEQADPATWLIVESDRYWAPCWGRPAGC